MTLLLGLPSKGRLMEKSFDWFGKAGLRFEREGSNREYAFQTNGLRGVQPVLLSAGEIPRELAAGRIHLGVTGSDMVRERIPDWPSTVEDVTGMGFGRADLVLAVPGCWIDVDSLDDLDAVAASFRAKHGFRLRIATKYHRLVREFLRDFGVANYQLMDSQGATEGVVKNGTAECVADITSTGETLRANHLKVLSDGLIHSSQATLFRSRTADWTTAKSVLEVLAARLGLPV
ncbi:ATP phosphoribosyltransferase [Actibacterium sp. 188UL27-1]|uniref:ATP phosphoribosyltransferase n=1 Tax=Actibacterium sp. 188UL27-1 TaxID=2786961 RepID=UPI00195AE054|nr:ATP phosphoribosyltransferase [Actibacterium sp. 188UL27-1]MBM7067376.1 ATP phosphoribosyltransferase [Actibacterium sp. 188UL27-1]